MKKILSLFLLLSMTLATATVAFAQGGNPPIPGPPVDTAVLDTLDWLSPAQEDEINSIVFELDADGLAQFAVVTLNDCGEDSQRFRYELFNGWGIGHADDNNGLLILVCWYDGVQGKRSLEQETGLGMEGIIPDLLADRVFQEHFVAAFSQGKPDSEVISSGEAGAALVAMVHAYDETIRQEPEPTIMISSETGQESDNGVLFVVVAILIILVVIAVGAAYLGGTQSSTTGTYEPPYRPSSWVGGTGPSRSTRRRDEEEDPDDDDDSSGMNFPTGGFSPPSRPSSSPNRGSFNFGGGRSMGGGRSGKF